MWSVYYGSTPATDSLLNIRYVLSDQEFPGYQAAGQNGSLTLWKNPDALPLAYVAQGSISPQLPQGDTPFQVQEQLLGQLIGTHQEVFSPVDMKVQDEQGQVTLLIHGTGQPVYAYLAQAQFTSLSVDGAYRCSLTPYEERRIHYLGCPAAGETLAVTVAYTGVLPTLDWNSLVQQLDQPFLSETLSQLHNTQMEKVTNTLVSLQATADTPSTLVTTIPAEDGWTAYVDGQKVATQVCWDTFLALELPSGTHQVTFRYTPPGLLPGLMMGGVTVLAGLVWMLLTRKKA